MVCSNRNLCRPNQEKHMNLQRAHLFLIPSSVFKFNCFDSNIPTVLENRGEFFSFCLPKMSSLTICLFLMLFSFGLAHENLNSHIFPRPLIVEYPEGGEFQFRESLEELRLQCTSWRFAVETNNLSPWKTIPVECADYVKDYMTSRAYAVDLERVSKEAGNFARSQELGEDGMDAWVFDVDETLLSNLPYYAEHGYGFDQEASKEIIIWTRIGGLILQLSYKYALCGFHTP